MPRFSIEQTAHWGTVYCIECGSVIQPNLDNGRTYHISRKFCNRKCWSVHCAKQRIPPPKFCLYCGTEIPFANRRRDYCDHECLLLSGALVRLHPRPWPDRFCVICNTRLLPRHGESWQRWISRQFCAICNDQRTGQFAAHWQGGRRLRDDGYIMLNLNGVEILEHRYIAEQLLGRPLTDDEITHHINEVRTDNEPANLFICSRPEHVRIHTRMRHAKEADLPYPVDLLLNGVWLGGVQPRQDFRNSDILPAGNNGRDELQQ